MYFSKIAWSEFTHVGLPIRGRLLCAKLRTSISGRELTDQLNERRMAKEYPLFVEPEDLSPYLQKPVWAFSMQFTTSRPISVRPLFFF
jgi:hypothetical protein